LLPFSGTFHCSEVPEGELYAGVTEIRNSPVISGHCLFAHLIQLFESAAVPNQDLVCMLIQHLCRAEIIVEEFQPVAAHHPGRVLVRHADGFQSGCYVAEILVAGEPAGLGREAGIVL